MVRGGNMNTKSLKKLVQLLNRPKIRGVLGQEKATILQRALKNLATGVQTKSVKKTSKAVEIISKLLVEILDL